MERVEQEIIEKLENVFEHPDETRIEILNDSIDLLFSSSQKAKIIYHNIQFAAIYRREDHHLPKLLDFLKETPVIINDLDSKKRLVLNIYHIFQNRKEDYKSIKDYVSQIESIFNNLNIDIYSSSIGGKDFLNHLLDTFGLEKIEEIEKEIGTKYLLHKNCIDSSVFYNFFSTEENLEKVDPTKLKKRYEIKDINIFLRQSINYFSKENATHMKWLSHVSIPVNIEFPALIEFNQKHKEESIHKTIKDNLEGSLIYDVYSKGIKIKNYSNDFKDLKIEEVKDFKEMAFQFFGRKNTKLINLLSQCCFQDNCFYFSYLYLGPMVKSLNIDKIHLILESIVKTKTKINLVRQFTQSEIEDLAILQTHYPFKGVEQLFTSASLDLNSIYGFLYKTRGYLSTVELTHKVKDFSLLLSSLQKSIDHIRREGFPLDLNDYSDQIHTIEGKDVLEYKVVLPKKSTDLIDWGHELKNCLTDEKWGVRKIINRQSLIFALYLNQKPAYCIEIIKRKVNQFQGKFNSLPSIKLSEEVISLLKESDLIDE